MIRNVVAAGAGAAVLAAATALVLTTHGGAAVRVGPVADSTRSKPVGWHNMPVPSGVKGGLTAVDATGPKNAWAVGAVTSGFSAMTTILRWNGTSWARQATSAQFQPVDVAASGPNHAWIIGTASFVKPTSLYWNGHAWSPAAFPQAGLPVEVSASPDGTAWSLLGLNLSGGGISTLLRWTGSAWVKAPAPLGASIDSVSVRAKNDVWVSGTTTNGLAVFPLVSHWNGSAWQSTKIPGTLGVPAYQGVLNKIVPVSANNVWVLRSAQNAQLLNALLHWDGRTWQAYPTPLDAEAIGLTDDGHGGAWVLPAVQGTRSFYLHWTGASWSKVYGPARSGQVGDVTRIPGTTEVLAAGSIAQQTPLLEILR